MNFKFHGDSHYWCWGHRHAPDTFGFRSTHINKLLGPSPYAFDKPNSLGPGIWDNISIIEMFLEKMGHRVSTTCSPGNNFNNTVCTIVELAPLDLTIDYNVVFYSMDLRGEKLNDHILKHGSNGYNEWAKKYDAVTVSNLDRLGKYANEIGQQYLIIGCQGTLFQEVFDQCSFKQNLHLVSECIFYSIFNDPDRQQLVFKLTDLPFDNPETAGDSLQHYHPEIINKIWEDIKVFAVFAGRQLYPDRSHLNASEVIFLLDILFGYIEKKFGSLDE